MASTDAIRNHATFIWSVADLLRDDYKQSEYGRVILPLVVLRRLDCVLEPTKVEVLAKFEALKGSGIENVEPVLCAVSGEQFYNTSKLDLPKLLDDPANIADNLHAYILGFSPGAREVLDRFDFAVQIDRLNKSKLLYPLVIRFCEIDLHPEAVSNLEMGYLYEELIWRFSELSNERAGEQFTPREVIRLMVNLLFIEDDPVLAKPGVVRTLYDPACGTGGMLSIAQDHLRDLNPGARLEVFGQELNAETYAICRSDMMLKGQDPSHIHLGNSFTEDGEKNRTFDYMLANPPFGMEWKSVEHEIKAEAEQLGFGGRFGAGLPRINDGSFLFLQHMLSKMKPVEEGGSRLAIVFNGSPLFTGAAGSGESEIRRWIIENDWLEAVIDLPDQLFYNTGISTYLWVLTNRKGPERQGKVQLVDSREFFTKMPRSLAEKRKEISPEQIAEITRLYRAFEENEKVKVYRNDQFGYQQITVERPLRLRFEVNEDTAEKFASSKAYAKLAGTDQERLVAVLGSLRGLSTENPAEALSAFSDALGKLAKNTERAILDAISVRDPDAPGVTSDGQPEPDTDLRDIESVPLPSTPVSFEANASDRLFSHEYRSAIEEYIVAKVPPLASDAWIDHTKTKIGYEIVTRTQLTATEQLNRLLAIGGYPVRRLGELGTVRSVTLHAEAPFDPSPNALYLSEIGAVATVAPTSNEAKPRRYVEVCLDADQAQAGFVAAWLVSTVGKAARDRASQGVTIPRVTVKSVAELRVALPPLTSQVEAVRLEQRLRNIGIEAEELRSKLWRNPGQTREIKQRLGGLEGPDPREQWMQSLPFPLASVVYRYLAADAPEERVEHLLHLFEATAEFAAALLLSAFYTDADLFSSERKRLASSTPTGESPFERSTFGTWTSAGQTLAKSTRRLLSQPDSRELCLRMFGARDDGFATGLASKDLWRVLDEARGVRNAIRHGGILSRALRERVLERLDGLLVDLREASLRLFDEVEVVQAGRISFRDGIFVHRVRRLTGPNQILRTRELQSSVALAEDGLFVVDREGRVDGALAILGFLRLLPSPETELNALYFYSGRLPDRSLEYVSYHFEAAPALPIADERLSAFLDELGQGD